MTDIAAKADQEISRWGDPIETLFSMLLRLERSQWHNQRLTNEQKQIVRYLIDNNLEDIVEDLSANKKSGTRAFHRQILRYASTEAKVYITMKLGFHD